LARPWELVIVGRILDGEGFDLWVESTVKIEVPLILFASSFTLVAQTLDKP